MELRRLAKRIGQFLFGATCLVAVYLVVAAVVVSFDPTDFPQAKGTPIGLMAVVFALFFGALSDLFHAVSIGLNEPVKLWELIVAGFLIAGAIKRAIADAVGQIKGHA